MVLGALGLLSDLSSFAGHRTGAKAGAHCSGPGYPHSPQVGRFSCVEGSPGVETTVILVALSPSPLRAGAWQGLEKRQNRKRK